MRVLHVDSAREWRGGQTQLRWLVEGSDDALVLPRRALLRSCFPDAWPYGPVGLLRAIRAVQPDLIAAHTSQAHGLAVLQRRVPVIVHRRLDFPPRRSSRLKYAAAFGFVAVSRAVADVLERSGVPGERIRVVYDGVRFAPGTPIARPSGPLVVAVGALVAHKGHASLVRAAALGGFRVWIAGEGPLRGSLERLVARLDAPVTLLGQRDDVPDLLATADVFCHPSVDEGLGQGLIEARAAGCRIVATRRGGIPEIAGPGARLVSEAAPSELAEAVLAALSDPWPEPCLPDGLSAATLRQRTFDAYSSLAGI
ncbi:MAG: glycosyltransferase [Myxococcota bacterium]